MKNFERWGKMNIELDKTGTAYMYSNNTTISIESPVPPSKITFSSGNDKEIGKLSFRDGTMVFEGNAEESALVFFEYLTGMVNNYMSDMELKIKRMRKQEKFLSRLGIDMSFLDEG